MSPVPLKLAASTTLIPIGSVNIPKLLWHMRLDLPVGQQNKQLEEHGMQFR